MGHNILVNKSSFVSREIKEAYRCLTRIMLNKKRSNSIAATEYDRLAEGEAPVIIALVFVQKHNGLFLISYRFPTLEKLMIFTSS